MIRLPFLNADRPSWFSRRKFKDELEIMRLQTEMGDQLPDELRRAIECVLAEYAAMFTGDEADESEVDSSMEELAWAYGRMTGWNANTELDGGEWRS